MATLSQLIGANTRLDTSADSGDKTISIFADLSDLTAPIPTIPSGIKILLGGSQTVRTTSTVSARAQGQRWVWLNIPITPDVGSFLVQDTSAKLQPFIVVGSLPNQQVERGRVIYVDVGSAFTLHGSASQLTYTMSNPTPVNATARIKANGILTITAKVPIASTMITVTAHLGQDVSASVDVNLQVIGNPNPATQTDFAHIRLVPGVSRTIDFRDYFSHPQDTGPLAFGDVKRVAGSSHVSVYFLRSKHEVTLTPAASLSANIGDLGAIQLDVRTQDGVLKTFRLIYEFVTNTPPKVANQMSDIVLYVGNDTPLAIDSHYFSDPDGTPLTVRPTIGTGNFSFADPSQFTGSDLTVKLTDKNSVTVTLRPLTAGDDELVITVTDADNTSATMRVPVIVRDPPHVVAGEPAKVEAVLKASSPLSLVDKIDLDVSGLFGSNSGEELGYSVVFDPPTGRARYTVAGSKLTIIPLTIGDLGVTLVASNNFDLAASVAIPDKLEIVDANVPRATSVSRPQLQQMLRQKGTVVEILDTTQDPATVERNIYALVSESKREVGYDPGSGFQFISKLSVLSDNPINLGTVIRALGTTASIVSTEPKIEANSVLYYVSTATISAVSGGSPGGVLPPSTTPPVQLSRISWRTFTQPSIIAPNTDIDITLPLAVDTGGGTVTYTAADLPDGVTFDPVTRKIGGQAAKGSYTITVTARVVGTDITPVTLAVELEIDTPPIGQLAVVRALNSLRGDYRFQIDNREAEETSDGKLRVFIDRKAGGDFDVAAGWPQINGKDVDYLADDGPFDKFDAGGGLYYYPEGSKAWAGPLRALKILADEKTARLTFDAYDQEYKYGEPLRESNNNFEFLAPPPVFGPLPDPIPVATAGKAYSLQLPAAVDRYGGTVSYTAYLLPAGLTMDNQLLISGTPTKIADTDILVRAESSLDDVWHSDLELTIKVEADTSIPPVLNWDMVNNVKLGTYTKGIAFSVQLPRVVTDRPDTITYDYTTVEPIPSGMIIDDKGILSGTWDGTVNGRILSPSDYVGDVYIKATSSLPGQTVVPETFTASLIARVP